MNKRLTDESDRIVRQGTAAWRRIKKEKSWNDWMAVGDALHVGRTFAMNDAGTNAPIGKGYNLAFNQFLIDAQLDDMDPSDRAKLFTVMENRPAIEQWRATLSQTERLRLNHPTSVLRKWQQATKEPKAKPDKATLKDSVIALDEEQHAAKDKIAQQQREIDDLKARVTELEEENAGLRDQLRDGKAKTTKAKAATLEWVEDEKGSSMNDDGRHRHTAQAEQGHYDINPSHDWGTKKFAGWQVSYWPPDAKAPDRRNVGGSYRDLEKAKAAAQRDYERQ